ncbi:unnamed protein product [Periconia digitata]|uniref:Uncharacterized protein n=1 Tax=Periconia digitata TaxID=1303443 RepID=A0A9W4U5I4_9PLEO|nr:unnamed protein product [Periconia digitata]
MLHSTQRAQCVHTWAVEAPRLRAMQLSAQSDNGDNGNAGWLPCKTDGCLFHGLKIAVRLLQPKCGGGGRLLFV